ncbi:MULTISPECIES: hypothetical protein [unclassified Vibrio]|uniref:hypothetical protein n=1 Tax=unclassified Vibrio TaxID=2614977 RepID=UPI0012685239|nr:MULTISPECIES: hypothetical protein [unclassified Vibrio]QFT40045.1 hypothetical protein FIU99_27015 [Vibrio sp. THAF64]QGM37990.1 hypothetical protein GGC04_27220 [Vibrio sp. THAF191d]QGN73430.1 hypothetical protein GGC03_26955 [Vibrio sp. THAF191c]
MTDRKRKVPPLSSTERGKRHAKKLAKFGIKRIYFRASETQRELVKQLQIITKCSSREELILDALVAYGHQHGLTLKQMKEDLECLKILPEQKS